MQVGWAEVAWEAQNKQRVFIMYSGPSGQSTWIWRPDIPIRSGDWITVVVDCCRYPNGQPHWGAWILQPTGWYQLALLNLGYERATVGRQISEVYTSDIHFPLPTTFFRNAQLCTVGPNCPFDPFEWFYWSEAKFPQTGMLPTELPYETHWPIKYYDWYARRH